MAESKSKEMSKCHMTIFHQQQFERQDYRHGSEHDITSLQRTFSKFGIVPIEKKDSKFKDIKKEVKNLSTADFTGHQLFMCVVLSHGVKKEYVWAKDKLFHLRKNMIDPISKNKTLNGVYKIFIVNACRGSGKFYESTDYLSEEDGGMLSTEDGVDYSNRLICYSTVEGHTTWRNSEKGTYYIYELCKLINEKGLHIDFHMLLVELNEKLNVLKKQVPIFETTFRKKLYLKDLLALSCDHITTTSSTEPKTIVICGETGVGKSTLGNLIVQLMNPDQNPPFKVMHCSMSCPMAENVKTTVKKAEFDVNVIDTPGFGDTEGPELTAMNVCHIWKALETDNVVAVLFLFKSRFTPTTKNWYDRLLKAIPELHHGNVFIVNTQFGGDESNKKEDFLHIRRLSDNPEAKISHVSNMYLIGANDRKKEILHLFDVWTSLQSFTVKNLKPPEIVYKKYELGPIEHRFYETFTTVEPRNEHYEEKRSDQHGEINLLTILTVDRQIIKDVWVDSQKKYGIRYDDTKDFVEEKILRRYIKDIEVRSNSIE